MNTKKCFFAPNGAPAVGPYSHAVAVGNLLFVSGQGPLAKDGSGPVHGTFEEEVRLTLDNLRAILNDAGTGFPYVVKTTVFLTDIANFGAFNEIYREYFPQDCPARSCIQAAALPKDTRVEVEAIAILPEK